MSECHEEVDQTGLDCNKEGFFVHSFKKQIPWVGVLTGDLADHFALGASF